MWQQTTKQDANKKIYEEELRPFLPKKILDFHLHIWNEGVVPADKPFNNAGAPLTKYDYTDLIRDFADSMPGIETSAVCFGFPDVDYDQRKNDEYVGNPPDKKRFFPLRLLDPLRDTPNLLRKDLETGRFFGIKPYLVYARKSDPNAVTIPDMLPQWAMDVVNDFGLLVMLHIPRKARLADPLNQKQVAEYCKNYPRTNIVLAHIGRAYYPQNVIGNLDRFLDLPNCYVDLAMLNHWEVLEYTFAHFPQDRILYGSDIPIALAAGKAVEINNQYTYVTPKPWNLSISDDHGKLEFTSFMYEEFRAIKKAFERLGLGEEFKQKLFYENGMRLLEQSR